MDDDFHMMVASILADDAQIKLDGRKSGILTIDNSDHSKIAN